jgi:O-antigen/teichoic acid export membrane protein
VARHPRQAGRAFATALRLKLILAAAVLVFLLVVTPWLVLPPAILWPLAAALFALSGVECLGYYLRGRGRIVGESGLLGADAVLACACGVAALLAGAGPAGLALSQVVAHGIAFAGAWFYVATIAPPPAVPGRLGPFLARSAPTGLAILLSIGSWRLGLLWLAHIGGRDTGFYATAHRLLEAARFVPAIAAAALFPSFARKVPAHTPWPALGILVPGAVVGCAIITRPAVSGFLVTSLFGFPYAASSFVLAAIAWALPFMTANAVLTHWLVARGRVRTNAALSGLHLVAHVAGLAWLVPALGAVGAGWALVGAEASLTAGTVACLLAR